MVNHDPSALVAPAGGTEVHTACRRPPVAASVTMPSHTGGSGAVWRGPDLPPDPHAMNASMPGLWEGGKGSSDGG